MQGKELTACIQIYAKQRFGSPCFTIYSSMLYIYPQKYVNPQKQPIERRGWEDMGEWADYIRSTGIRAFPEH